MSFDTIRAYSALERVQVYDAAMDLMHPNRPVMADVVLDILATGESPPRTILELGTGTGFLLNRALERFREAQFVAIDGAQPMLDVAAERIARHRGRVDFRVGDFRNLRAACATPHAFDAVISSYALHHLTLPEKAGLLNDVRELLVPSGWFLNADIVRCADPYVEERVQRMRVRGIVERAAGKHEQFSDEARTRRYLAELEAADHDQPQTLEDDQRAIEAAGLHHVTLFWRYTREVVLGAMRPAGSSAEL